MIQRQHTLTYTHTWPYVYKFDEWEYHRRTRQMNEQEWAHTHTCTRSLHDSHTHANNTSTARVCVYTHDEDGKRAHTERAKLRKKTNIKRVEEEDGKNTHIKRASERVRRVSFIDWIFWCCSRTGREEYRRIEAESVLPFAYLLTYIKSTHFTRFTLSHRNRRHNKIIIIKKDTNTHDREWERERKKIRKIWHTKIKPT